MKGQLRSGNDTVHNLNFLLMSGRVCTTFSSYTNIALYTVGKIAMHFLNTKMIFTSMKTVIKLVGNMQLVMYHLKNILAIFSTVYQTEEEEPFLSRLIRYSNRCIDIYTVSIYIVIYIKLQI